MVLCTYPMHQIINTINCILLVGIVGLVFYRYHLISSGVSQNNNYSSKQQDDNIQKTESSYNPEGMNYDDLINYHRSHFLKNYQSITFLDYATNPVLPGSVLQNFSKNLHENLFGNPHSESQSSELSTDTIDIIRSQILELFETNLSEYTVVFTYSQFHSMKLLTESFPFTQDSTFIYTSNSNNNILGLRSFAEKKNAKIQMVDINQVVKPESKFEKFPDIRKLIKHTNKEEEEKDANIAKNTNSNYVLIKKLNVTMNLLAVPLVDEFDGTVLAEEQMKHISVSSDYIGKTAVMVDASLYLQNHRLSLSSTPFHAVAMSFERIFGFPNIGCLLIHNSLMQLLAKPYFGGGTLVYALTSASYEKLRLSPQDRFEDGSLPFLSIASIESDFTLFLNDLKSSRISSHISSLIEYLFGQLNELRHSNGSPLVKIYTNQDQKQLQRQSIISFNVLDIKADIIPWKQIVDSASKNDIYLAGGCFSTPGSCIKWLQQDEKEIKTKIQNSEEDVASFGAIRVSIGWATTKNDIDNLINWLKKEFLK